MCLAVCRPLQILGRKLSAKTFDLFSVSHHICVFECVLFDQVKHQIILVLILTCDEVARLAKKFFLFYDVHIRLKPCFVSVSVFCYVERQSAVYSDQSERGKQYNRKMFFLFSILFEHYHLYLI